MLSQLTSSELMEWQEYYSIEPFGGERGDDQAAVISSTIANANPGAKDVPLANFRIDYLKEPSEKPSDEVLDRKMQAFVAMQKRRMDQNNGK